MNSILQITSDVIDAKPVWHPEAPGVAVSVGDFVKNTECANHGAVTSPCRNYKAKDQLIILISIKMLFRQVNDDHFLACNRLDGDRIARIAATWNAYFLAN